MNVVINLLFSDNRVWNLDEIVFFFQKWEKIAQKDDKRKNRGWKKEMRDIDER